MLDASEPYGRLRTMNFLAVKPPTPGFRRNIGSALTLWYTV